MSIAITALRGEYLDTRNFRFSRNQRDAGIEHLTWEGRMKPIRPLSVDIAVGLGVISAAATALMFI
jgi:hypothetical protein